MTGTCTVYTLGHTTLTLGTTSLPSNTTPTPSQACVKCNVCEMYKQTDILTHTVRAVRPQSHKIMEDDAAICTRNTFIMLFLGNKKISTDKLSMYSNILRIDYISDSCI